MNKDKSTEKLVTASIHLFYPTIDEAKQEAYRTGNPYFRTFIGGVEMYTVRPRKEVQNG